MNASKALGQMHVYNPWEIPDYYTVWVSAPKYLHDMLLPHWKTQKASENSRELFY